MDAETLLLSIQCEIAAWGYITYPWDEDEWINWPDRYYAQIETDNVAIFKDDRKTLLGTVRTLDYQSAVGAWREACIAAGDRELAPPHLRHLDRESTCTTAQGALKRFNLYLDAHPERKALVDAFFEEHPPTRDALAILKALKGGV